MKLVSSKCHEKKHVGLTEDIISFSCTCLVSSALSTPYVNEMCLVSTKQSNEHSYCLLTEHEFQRMSFVSHDLSAKGGVKA